METTTQWFVILKNNYREKPIRVSEPIRGENRAERARKEMESLTAEERENGFCYQLSEVSGPKVERIRSTGKSRGSKGAGR